jgi:hypothetical protein
MGFTVDVSLTRGELADARTVAWDAVAWEKFLVLSIHCESFLKINYFLILTNAHSTDHRQSPTHAAKNPAIGNTGIIGVNELAI